MNVFRRGVDVSYVQKIGSAGVIRRESDGKALATLDMFDFVIIKATQGNFVDPQWANSYAMARKFGKPVMAYHFNDNRVPIKTQVDLFLATAKDADFLWLDQEGDFGFSDAQAQQFIDLVRAAGRRCGLYHSASGFSGVNADGEWVADYRLESLQDSDTPVEGWDLWQFSSEGGPDGAGLDLNWMRADSPLAVLLGLDLVPRSDLTKALEDTRAAQDDLSQAQTVILQQQGTIGLLEEDKLRLAEEAKKAASQEKERIAVAYAQRQGAIIRNL